MRRIRTVIGIGALAATAAVGTGVAVADSDGTDDTDDTERPLAGDARTRAEAAALRHTQGGRVTSTELENEENLYEIEVTKADGTHVEVELDRNFKVVANDQDDVENEPDDADEAGDPDND